MIIQVYSFYWYAANNKEGTIKFDSRVKNLVPALRNNDGDDYELKDTNTETIQLIADYFNMHKYEPPVVKKPIKSSDLTENLHPLDHKFITELNTRQF